MLSENELIQQIEQHTKRLAYSLSAAKHWYDQTLAVAQQARHHQVAESRAHYQQTIDQVQYKLEQVTQIAGLWATPWNASVWPSYQPDIQASIPHYTRLGIFTEQGPFDKLELPALLPIIGGRNLLIKAARPALDQANEAMQSLMLRLLATLPPGKFRFTFIDPVDRGRNMAGFMHLADYIEALVGGQVWTEANYIQQRLEDITAHMDMVIQKYLRNQYATMEAYNKDAGEVEEPYRFIVVANFPAGFNEETARRLVSIARSGPSCGVYVLVTVDREMKMPYNFNIDELQETATLISHDGKRFVLQDETFNKCVLTQDDPPPNEQFNHIIHTVGEAAQRFSKVEVPFKRVVPASSDWWSAKADSSLRVPIGRIGARQHLYFELGRGTAQHALIAGKTGSGKSSLLHALIISLALYYSPDEVSLYLIDFKKGVEFKEYATHQLPHARIIAIESEREFGLSVLQGLDTELQRRGNLFRAAGGDNLKKYRAISGERMPRLLLLVDEFQEFFSEDDRLAQQASLILDRLVRQGRSFGIHVLLGSQSLAGAYSLARSTIDQMAVRIALQCSDADSRLILSDENDAARLLSRPGEAIYNAANGLVEGNVRAQVVWLPQEERQTYLTQLQTYAKEAAYAPSRPPIVFEGNEPARVEQNHHLNAQLTAKDWPAFSGIASAWLGDPVAIREQHTAAHFSRQARANLIVVGQDESAATGMLFVSLIGLAAQHQPDEACFYLLDMSPVNGAAKKISQQLAAILPHTFKVIRRRRQIAPLMEELGTLVEERLALESDEESGAAIYLIIFGLHMARELRQEEGGMGWYGSSFDDSPPPPNPAERFATILRDGPDVSVHTLSWCNTYTTLTRMIGRQGIGEFGMRVTMQMGADGSVQLLDSPAANKLGPNRAYFYDEEQVGHLEKFRPYAPPTADWLDWVAQQFTKR